MNEFDIKGKKQLSEHDNPFRRNAVVASDLLKQKFFGYKHSTQNFTNLYEIVSENTFCEKYIDCQEAFKAGESYQKLRFRKVKLQIAAGFLLGPRQLLMSNKKYTKVNDDLFDKYRSVHYALEEAKRYSDSISFGLGQEKAKLERKETLGIYAFFAGTIGCLAWNLYNEYK